MNMENIKKNFLEGSYKAVSVLNVTVNKVFKPAAQHTATMLGQAIKLEDEDNSSEIVLEIKKTLKTSAEFTGELVLKPWQFIGKFLDKTQDDMENTLKSKYKVDINQWIFSHDNLLVIEKIDALIDRVTTDIKYVGKYDGIQYLLAWTMLQKVSRIFKKEEIMQSLRNQQITKIEQEKIDDWYMQELLTIKTETAHFSLFANGTYGNAMNYIFSGKDFSKISEMDYDKAFLYHTKILKEDLIASYWDATPYHPAYVICKDRSTKSIVLCARGSNNWADAITDLDFHYLKIEC